MSGWLDLCNPWLAEGCGLNPAEGTGFLGNEFCPGVNEGRGGWRSGFGGIPGLGGN